MWTVDSTLMHLMPSRIARVTIYVPIDHVLCDLVQVVLTIITNWDTVDGKGQVRHAICCGPGSQASGALSSPSKEVSNINNYGTSHVNIR